MSRVKTISTDELHDAIESGEDIQIVNVLSADNYRLGLIENSLKIPLKDLDARIEELDKNQEVITYCSGGDSMASRKAAEKLAAEGYRVRAYEGGIQAWKDAGFTLEQADDDIEVDETPDAPSGLSGLPSSGRN